MQHDLHPDLDRAARREDPEAALSRAMVGLAALGALVRPSHPALVHPLLEVAARYLALGRLVEAERTLRRALHVAAAGGPATAALFARVARELARVWCQVGRYREADELARKAIGRCDDERLVVMAELEHLRGWALHARGELGEAKLHYRAALGVYGRAPGTQWLAVAGVCHNLGVALTGLGDLEQARVLLWRAARIRAQQGGRSVDLAATLEALADGALAAGQLEAAQRLLGRAVFCLGSPTQAASPHRRRRLLRKLATALERAGRSAAAKRVRARLGSST